MHIRPKRNRKRHIILTFIVLFIVVVAGVGFAIFATKPSPVTSSAVTNQPTPTARLKKTSLLLPHAQTSIPLPLDKSLLARPDGRLVLVNKKAPIDLGYAPTDLVLPTVPYRTDKAQEEVMVRKALVEPLSSMFADAKAEGIELMIGSAYRSSELQATYFNSYVKASGLAEAEKYSAHPGTSEHQLGLAVDLTTVDRLCYLVECFEGTPAGKWLNMHAHEYGFILRYPNGRTDVTGYNYEPWHFRYVGVTIATAIYESGLTYEEAFPYLSGAKQP